MRIFLVVVLFLFFGCKSTTKQVFIQNTSAFKELLLPAPNAIRTGSGAPGVDYWQQRVDHDVANEAHLVVRHPFFAQVLDATWL